MSDAIEANHRWAQMLTDWAIPERLVERAPVSPYFFDPAVFAAAADEAMHRKVDTPSDRAAREALPPGGVVLDVGVGAGAASLPLGAGRIIGVDPNAALLDEFAERCDQLGISHESVHGSWPDVAAETPRADVVVCHHVVYNSSDLAAFAQELTQHARQTVVIELTAVHPMTWLAEYWTALHGLDQPDRPVADDAIDVLIEIGLSPSQARWTKSIQMIGEAGADRVDRIARRLCVGSERHEELQKLLDATPPPLERDVVTVWWPSRR